MQAHAFYALTPTEFEVYVGDVLGRNGYRDIEHTGRSGDRGVDLRCTDPRGRRVAVQCKHHVRGQNVGDDVVRNLIGSLGLSGAQRGILVTSSGFTSRALETAASVGITMIDGDALSAMDVNPAGGLPLLGLWPRYVLKALVSHPRAGIAVVLFLLAISLLNHPVGTTSQASPAPPSANAQATYAASHRASMTVQKMGPAIFQVHASGFLPGEPVTAGIDAEPFCQHGGPCSWKYNADRGGQLLVMIDLGYLPPGTYWYGLHGDKSANFAPTTQITITGDTPIPAASTASASLPATASPASTAAAALMKATLMIGRAANGDFVIHASGFKPDEALTVYMGQADGSGCVSTDGAGCIWQRQADANGDYGLSTPLDAVITTGAHWYWIIGADGEQTNHVQVMLPKTAAPPVASTAVPASDLQINVTPLSGTVLRIHVTGLLPNEPITVRMGADKGPNCQWQGQPCIWHRVAAGNGGYDRDSDLTEINGRGKYWYSISGDISGRSTLTSFQLVD